MFLEGKINGKLILQFIKNPPKKCLVSLETKIQEMESRLGASSATTKEKEVAISDINQVITNYS
jgi:hypothetical protein